MVDITKLLPVRLKYLAKIKRITIDDPVFHLHYRVTCVMLVLAGALTTLDTLIGRPIMCIKGKL